MLFLLCFLKLSFAEGELLSGTNYLRSASLDVRGRLPSAEEYDGIEDGGAIPEALLDDWLSSEDFYQQVIYFHNLLLLNHLGFVKFQNFVHYLDTNGDIYYIRRRTYRKGTSDESPACSDFEATLDENQRPIPVVNADGSLDEGYVLVNPYWAPETQIKVCAFEAQEREFTTFGVDCKTEEGAADAECGCGPNLNWCTPKFVVGVYHEIVNDLDEQIDQYIRTVVAEDRPYTEIFTGDWLPLNGPLTHMYKYLVFHPHGVVMENPAFDRTMMPDLIYQDADVWVEVPAIEASAGIFSLPGFLLRFHTNRRRADRVLSEFMCTELMPPESGLPESTAEEQSDGDLRQMYGCSSCHVYLEPMAGYWGRWEEGGSSHYSPEEYPAFSEECNEAARQGSTHPSYYECKDRGYLVDSHHGDMVGWYWSHASLYEEEQHYPVVGPRLLFQKEIVNGRIPSCVVQKTVQQILGRPLREEDQDWKSRLTYNFITNNYNYKHLVKDIITSKQYRSRK
ncbi:MAG: hypothetical protein VX278_00585 [Myxococcota bacterium]|nr:hypothetical protein [Myxococcota bacterium]